MRWCEDASYASVWIRGEGDREEREEVEMVVVGGKEGKGGREGVSTRQTKRCTVRD